MARLRRARRGLSGGDGWRGAVCRHGAFRQAADSSGVVRAGASRAAAELLRAGRAVAHQSRGCGEQPFFLLAPSWALYPLVALATAAAIIASQALISGAFSLTRQAIQLGYCPRLDIDHTSSVEIGQIYVPQVNWALMISTIAIVIGFGSSTALAAAYGIAVTLTMVITALLLHVVAVERWRWPAGGRRRGHRMCSSRSIWRSSARTP